MKRFLKVLEGIVPALAVLGIQLVWSFIFSFVLMIGLIVNVMISSGELKDVNASISYITYEIMNGADFMFLVTVTSIIVTGVVFFLWYHRIIRFERKILYKKALDIRNIVFIVLLGFACQIFISGFMGLIQPYFVDAFEDYSKVMEIIVGANPILVILFVVIIAPIAEELIFRGVILKKLERALPFLWANLIQALLFGIYHLNWIQGIYAFVLGAIIGYVTKKCKTILAPILLHMAVNGSSFLMFLYPEGIIAYILLMAVSVVIIIFTLMNLKGYVEDNQLDSNNII